MAKLKDLVFETMLSSYRYASVLGQGGAGTVIEVKNDEGDNLALKFMAPENLRTENIKRFKNELMFCSREDHPNIIKVLDWGFVDIQGAKSPFYVMPLHATSLRNLIESGIEPGQVLAMFAQILDGVEAAHLKGVHHRDLKPENILYHDSDGRLILADFGIARFAEENLHTLIETKAKAKLANFQYASPEQREVGGSVDHRADIFSLGMILNEMFTGKLALGHGFTKIGDVVGEYGYLDGIVEKLLSSSPDDRHSSIGELKRELIGHRNDFISEQKLSELKGTVIPETELDDPLILTPPEMVDAKWDNGRLVLLLSCEINQLWQVCFKSPDVSHQSIWGKDPGHFDVRGNQLIIHSDGNDAQKIIDYTKGYIEMANAQYRRRVEHEMKEQQRKEKANLQKQIAVKERASDINKNLKI